MSFATLIFDLDGTLVDSLVDLGNAVNRLRDDLQLPPLVLAEISACVGDGARLLVERTLPEGHFSEERLQQFLEHYRQHLVEETKPYPGVVACLEACRDRSMAVVTNKPIDFTLSILERLGLRHYFPVVIGGDSLPTKKPDPAPVVQALAELGQPAESALMIGDHVNDLLAGQGAGTRTCFCRWGLGEHQGVSHDFEVATPLALYELLTSGSSL